MDFITELQCGLAILLIDVKLVNILFILRVVVILLFIFMTYMVILSQLSVWAILGQAMHSDLGYPAEGTD